MDSRPDNKATEPRGLNEAQVMHAMSIDDAYHVERVLGSGASGVTECVTIDGTGPFIRKKIPRDQAHRAVWATLADCRCPLLPQIRATYEMPDWYVVVCDYVSGETLQQKVARQGALPADEAMRLVGDLCDAVGELHAHGIVHRDLSPANVVLAADGAHVIDFGLARLRLEQPAADTSRTPDSTPLGTWGFAAPEQYGFAGTDARSDIYSLGRLLGFALTGVRPDDGRYDALLQDERVVDPVLRTIVDRCCAFEPSTRYQSAAELARALDGDDRSPSPHAAKASKRNAAPQPPQAYATTTTPQKPNGSGTEAAVGNRTGASTEAETIEGETASHAPKKPSGNRRPIIIATLCTAIAVTIVAVMLVASNSLPFLSSGNAEQDSGSNASTDPKADQNRSSGTNDIDEAILNAMLNGEGTDATSTAPSNASIALELPESGWTYETNGYVNYAYAITNPSEQLAVRFPKITVTGRNDDGSIIFSQTDVLSPIGPGQTLRFTSIAASETRPATVEFAALAPSADNVFESTPFSEFTVSNVSVIPGNYGNVSVTGEVASGEGAEPPLSYGLQIAVILRDDQGNPIGGTTTYPDKPSPGASAPFEVQLYAGSSYATVDVYAQHW